MKAAGVCSGCLTATRWTSFLEHLYFLKRPAPKCINTAAMHMHLWDQARVMSKLVSWWISETFSSKGLLEIVHVFQIGGAGHDEKSGKEHPNQHTKTEKKTADASQISPLALVALRHSNRCCVLPSLLLRFHPAPTVRWTTIEMAAYPGSHQANIIFQYSSCSYSQETWEQRPRCERELCSNRGMEDRRSPLRPP